MGYLEDMMYVGELTHMHSSLSCGARVLGRRNSLKMRVLQLIICPKKTEEVQLLAIAFKILAPQRSKHQVSVQALKAAKGIKSCSALSGMFLRGT